MALVFISHCSADKHYARRLKDALFEYRLEVWIDDGIPIGAKWFDEIVDGIRRCGALVVIMTPEAAQSEWVNREIRQANSERKRLFPLLLRGECFPTLKDIQYEDVRSGDLPPKRFFTDLTDHLGHRRIPEFAKDIVRKDFAYLQDDMTIRDAVTVLLRSDKLAAIVVRGNQIIGIVSLVELLKFVTKYFDQVLPSDASVSSVMLQHSSLFSVTADFPIRDIAKLLKGNSFQYVLVLDEEQQPMGIVSRDVFIALDFD